MRSFWKHQLKQDGWLPDSYPFEGAQRLTVISIGCVRRDLNAKSVSEKQSGVFRKFEIA